MSDKYDRFEAVYATLEDLMAARKENVTFLEVNCGDGGRAAKLCRYWREQTDGKFTYVGFDPFAVTPKETVADRLRRAGADATLMAGPVQETVQAFAEVMGRQVVPDVVLFDPLDLSADDVDAVWAGVAAVVRPSSFVLVDRYTDREGYGCKKLIERLAKDARWRVEFLPEIDRLPCGTLVKLACVQLTGGLPAAAARAA